MIRLIISFNYRNLLHFVIGHMGESFVPETDDSDQVSKKRLHNIQQLIRSDLEALKKGVDANPECPKQVLSPKP